jgi:subtilisin family serine protease
VYACGHSPLCKELRRLWRQGVMVCIAAGNRGLMEIQTRAGFQQANLDLTIGDPANLEEAIAVGSVHNTNPFTYGVSYFSSRGPTADGRIKPDVIAPGEKILSANSRFSSPDSMNVTDLYVKLSGTSMAAPHISGMIAAFLSLRREYIGYPDQVKQILLESCTPLGRDAYSEGRGLPSLMKMLSNA